MRQPLVVRRGALLVAVAALAACATTSSSRIQTFAEPSLGTSELRRVAMLPIRGDRLTPGELAQLSDGFVRAFRSVNPGVGIVDPTTATRTLNSEGLVERYAEFLRNQETAGMADTRTLRTITEALGVDAIIQGEIVEARQNEAEGWHEWARPPETTITLRYVLLANDGAVLWQSTASGRLKRTTMIQDVPSLAATAAVAQERIVRELPTIGHR